MRNTARRGNRRHSPRRVPRGTVRASCLPACPGPDLAVAVLDLSETGICLALKGPLDPGQEVLVRLERRGHPLKVERAARVAWCVLSEEGAYSAGLTFKGLLAPRDYLDLTQDRSCDAPRPPDAAAGERRRYERRAGERLFHCRLSVTPGGPDLAAMVFDLCRGGAGLMATRRLEPGAAVVLRIAEAGGGRPAMDLAARVVYEEELCGGWYVTGVDFLTPLSGEQLATMLARIGRACGD